MVDKLHKAFVDATYNVFNMMLNISDLSNYPMEEFSCDDEIGISVGVVGELQGDVIYRFPVETSLNMVKIMSGMEFDAVDIFVTSAISEIANIISGNVISALSDKELKYDILPPVEVDPNDNKEHEIESSCCIRTSIGDICLQVRLNKAA
ncbi:MAG: chemotaxis protein CheX [Clostridiales bacterium]|nr:chemotaxis protein CheX [Clostridiales bacterium]